MRKTLYVLIILAAGIAGARGESLDAVIDWSHKVPMGPLVGGTVQSLSVAVGDKIAKGTELLRIDQTPFQLRLDMHISQLELASAERDSAAAEYERQKELYDNGSLSTVELQRVELELARKKALYQSVKTEVGVARYRLSLTMLRAPFDARVIDTRIMPGQNVSVAQGIPVGVVLARSNEYAAMVQTPVTSNRAFTGHATVVVNDKRYTGKPEFRYDSNTPDSGAVLIVRFTERDGSIHPGAAAKVILE